MEQAEMTSEVAVLTKQAVALAADSAVTTGNNKIFNTVNKVFALSKHEPVGIMVYSSAEVMGVPVETAIKEFRRSQGRCQRAHLEDYAAAFEEFLQKDDSVFTPEARIGSLASVARECVRRLHSGSWKKLRAISGWGHPTKAEARDALLQTLTECENRVTASQPLAVARPSQAKKLIAGAVDSELGNWIAWLRQSLPVSTSTERRVRRLVPEFCCHSADSGVETGFVIAGFGAGDVFPRLRSFEFCHSALGVHKVRYGDPVSISDQLIAQICPFAQSEVMLTFVGGIDPTYWEALEASLGGFFEVKKDQVKHSPGELALVRSIEQELGQKLSSGLAEVRREKFFSPLMTVVASMPKEELALLAEALVNLTALKRRASRDAETVGGPTDVAVISKGDGLVWINRKHYFDAKFNPAFTGRYLEVRDETAGSGGGDAA
jgi:hypothetical protein